MKRLFFILVAAEFFVSGLKTGEVELKCTQEFCEDYIQRFPCPQLNRLCYNKTKSIVLPSPTVCNCCEHCFTFQDEGEYCVIGRPGQPLPTLMCKPGTECIKGICQNKTTPDPDFHPGYECNETTCKCMAIEDNRLVKIFGEFPKTENISNEKQCRCSNFAYQARQSINKFLPFPDLYAPTPRCLSNGQYDPLQCMDYMCGCVDKETGEWDFTESRVPIKALGPNSPKCFEKGRHKIGEYYKTCEIERNELMNEKFWGDLEGVSILFSHKVMCTPDGEYENLPED